MTLVLPLAFGAPQRLRRGLASRQRGLALALLQGRSLNDCRGRFVDALTGAELQRLLNDRLDPGPLGEDAAVGSRPAASRPALFALADRPSPARAPVAPSPNAGRHVAAALNPEPRVSPGLFKAEAVARTDRRAAPPNRAAKPAADAVADRSANVSTDATSSSIGAVAFTPAGQTAVGERGAAAYVRLLTAAIKSYWRDVDSNEAAAATTTTTTAPPPPPPFGATSVPSTASPGEMAALPSSPFAAVPVQTFRGQIQRNGPVVDASAARAATAQPEPSLSGVPPAVEYPPTWRRDAAAGGGEDALAGQLAEVLFKQALLHGIDVT